MIVINIVGANCSIVSAGNDDILLRVHNDTAHFVSQFKNLIAFYALLFALLAQLEAENWAFGVEVPSGRTASEGNHRTVDYVVVESGVSCFEIFGNIVLLFGEFFEVDEFYSLVGAKAY